MNRPTFYTLLLIILIIGGVIRPTQAQDENLVANTPPESFDLRPHWIEGQSARYSFNTARHEQVDMTFQGNERSAESLFKSRGEATWEVESVEEDGSAVVSMTYDWLVLEYESSEGPNQVFDSREPRQKDEPLSHLVHDISSHTFEMHYEPDGSIDEIRGVDELINQAEMPDLMPDERDFYESFTGLICPPKAPQDARLGDSWEDQYVWNHRVGEMKYDTTYTVANYELIEGIPVVTILAEADLELIPDPEKMPAPPDARVRAKLEEGNMTVTSLYDLSRQEIVGQHESKTTVYTLKLSSADINLTQRLTTNVQSQTIRIEEVE